jgi:membrane-associated HD superfamily phosphohydrolase
MVQNLKCQKKCPSKRFLKRCNTKLKFEAVQRYNVLSALDFFILLQKTQIANFDGSKYLFSIFCGPKIIFFNLLFIYFFFVCVCVCVVYLHLQAKGVLWFLRIYPERSPESPTVLILRKSISTVDSVIASPVWLSVVYFRNQLQFPVNVNFATLSIKRLNIPVIWPPKI